MPKFAVEIRVMPRPTLLDPQGKAVEHALGALGFQQVERVRVGKALTLMVEQPDRNTAERTAKAMCERLLANPVTEDFQVSITEAR